MVLFSFFFFLNQVNTSIGFPFFGRLHLRRGSTCDPFKGKKKKSVQQQQQQQQQKDKQALFECQKEGGKRKKKTDFS